MCYSMNDIMNFKFNTLIKNIIFFLLIPLTLMLMLNCSKKSKSITSNQDSLEINQTEKIDQNITSNTNWEADKEYQITKTITIKKDATLTIEAGTMVKVNSADELGNKIFIIVEQGAKLNAVGSVSKPITFTSSRSSSELPKRGDWGGIIICGKAPINNSTTEIEQVISQNQSTNYGGSNSTDSSGELKYIKILNAGAAGAAGLTLAGVGSGSNMSF